MSLQQLQSNLLFLGKDYEVVQIIYNDDKIKIFIRGKNIEIYIPKIIKKVDYKYLIWGKLKIWYREMCRDIIEEKLNNYCRILNVKYNNFRIKDQKTRWGSCSSKNNLNFNWRIIMAPEWVLDYIIVHELCHLIHFNHSKDFWNEVRKYIPNYEEAILWLKVNGYKLMSIN